MHPEAVPEKFKDFLYEIDTSKLRRAELEDNALPEDLFKELQSALVVVHEAEVLWDRLPAYVQLDLRKFVGNIVSQYRQIQKLDLKESDWPNQIRQFGRAVQEGLINTVKLRPDVRASASSVAEIQEEFEKGKQKVAELVLRWS